MANVSSSNGLEKRPKLRFPGFDEPYRSTQLEDIASLVNRTDPKSNAPIMMLSAGKIRYNKFRKLKSRKRDMVCSPLVE